MADVYSLSLQSGVFKQIAQTDVILAAGMKYAGGTVTFTATTVSIVGNLTGNGTLSGFTSVEGITSANLLDKSAVETVGGAWTFTGGMTWGTDAAAQTANTMYGNLTIGSGTNNYNLTVNGDLSVTGTISGTFASEQIEKSYTASGAIAAGEAVRVSANGTVTKAQANTEANAKGFLGVAESAIADTIAGNITNVGYLGAAKFVATLTVAAGDRVYLSAATAGAFTNVAPAGSGNAVLPIGYIVDTANYVGATTCAVQLFPQDYVVLP